MPSICIHSGSHRIKHVTAHDDYSLSITFDNDEVRLYDMKNNLFGVMSVLADKQKFSEAFVDDLGNLAWDINSEVDSNVFWNNRIDICKDSIYLNSN